VYNISCPIETQLKAIFFVNFKIVDEPGANTKKLTTKLSVKDFFSHNCFIEKSAV
jgi:hypothetical protein